MQAIYTAASLCYGLHIVCCDEIGLTEWEVEDTAVSLIRAIRSQHAVGLWVG